MPSNSSPITSRRDLLPWIEEREREAAEGLAMLTPAYVASINAAIQFRDWPSLARLAFCYAKAHGVASLCLLDACRVVNATKGRGYAGADDFLANFYRVAERESIDPQRVVAVYLWKHFDWIVTFQKTGTQHGDEGLLSRCGDLILYAALGQAIADREREASVLRREPGDRDAMPLLDALTASEPVTEVLAR